MCERPQQRAAIMCSSTSHLWYCVPTLPQPAAHVAARGRAPDAQKHTLDQPGRLGWIDTWVRSGTGVSANHCTTDCDRARRGGQAGRGRQTNRGSRQADGAGQAGGSGQADGSGKTSTCRRTRIRCAHYPR